MMGIGGGLSNKHEEATAGLHLDLRMSGVQLQDCVTLCLLRPRSCGSILLLLLGKLLYELLVRPARTHHTRGLLQSCPGHKENFQVSRAQQLC